MERSSTEAPSRALSTVTLMRRMLTGVVLALAGFGLTHRLATEVAGLDMLMALLPATLVALVVAAVVMPRTVSPLVAVQADLQVRYEAAVADSLRDQLTGLGNHRAFHEELDRQVERALAEEAPISLLLIDLDEFKQMNDTRGHAAGDAVLRGFGRMLTATLRRSDRAYRVGGDEFAVVMPGTDLESARLMGRRLLAQALQPALHHEEHSPVSFSGGISTIPELADGRARLYSQADSALYAAKRGGRTDVVAYDSSIEVIDDAAARGSATAAVAEVIARGQLAAVYQPIVALASGRVLGVEGLIRPVPPAPFADAGALFEAAEAGGRLTALDLACLEPIVRGARGLPADVFLSVNLSPTTFESPEFSATTLLNILARHDFDPDRVVVELTERQALHDPSRVRDRIDACRRAGIRFAADDIGAGNAGLRLLSEISFDILKVDLDLVQRGSDGPSGAVLGSVVELATRMGALLVAEGIEHASQLPALSALGIQAGQGHHLGRPGPIDDAVPVVELEPIGIASWRQSIGLPTAS